MKKPTQTENNCHPYPELVCGDCAIANGGKWQKGHVATCHNGTCGWCGQIRAVTEPKHFGFWAVTEPKHFGSCQSNSL